MSPPRSLAPPSTSIWLRWAVNPSKHNQPSPCLPPASRLLGSAFTVLLVPVVLYANWQLLAPLTSPGFPNPFAPFFLLSGFVPSSSPNDPRYAKSFLDLLFIAYYVVFWSFVRQSLTIYVSRPVAGYFRIRKEAKIDRFGEQTYAFLYFFVVGVWGFVSAPFPSNRAILISMPAYHVPTTYFLVSHGALLDRSEYPSLISQNNINSAMRRLSPLGHEARVETLLSHAVSLLVSATTRSVTWTRKTAQRLSRTSCTPSSHALVGRVCRIPDVARRSLTHVVGGAI